MLFLEEIVYAEGESIFEENDSDDQSLYIIKKGNI